MNKVLMVTFWWPPERGSGVWRPTKFAKYLPDFGWEPSVLTALKDDLRRTGEELAACGVGSVPVSVAPPGGGRTVGRVLGRALGPVAGLVGRSGADIERSVGWRSTRWCSFPDEGTACNKWVFTLASQAVRMVRRGGFDAVYVTSPPASMAIVAGLIADRINRPVLVDFRDPWTHYFGNRYTGWKHRLACRLEHWCLRKTARAVAATEVQLEMLAESYPDCAEKMVCITNGFDPEDVPESAGRTTDGLFVLALLGMLYDPPGPLFEAIRTCCRRDERFARLFRFRWIGADEQAGRLAEACGIADRVELLERLPQKESIERAADSTALWLDVPKSGDTRYVVPSKVYDYLALGRPILDVSPETACSNRILERAGVRRLTASDDAESIAGMLAKAFELWRRGRFAAHVDPEAVARFRRDNLAGRLAGVMDGMVEGYRSGRRNR